MAKSSKRTLKAPTSSKPASSNRRVVLFLICVLLIGYMLWQVLLSLGAASRAAGTPGNVCRPQNQRTLSAFARLGFCHVDRAQSCGDSCNCVPFRPGFKFGRCVPTTDPKPTNRPVICTADAQQCPDGSWVGRRGPNCEFVCPSK